MRVQASSLISSTVLCQKPQLAEAFRTARPFRHVVIDGFFEPAICERLLAEFPRFEQRFALNELGKVGGKAVRTHVRDLSETYRLVDDSIQRPEFLDFVSAITGIPGLRYDPDYVGGGTHENQDGQGLDPHVDFNYHPKTKQHRRLNLIVYLNREWEEAWGGTLELQSNPWDPANNTTKSVLPLFNRAVLFETTEASWHGFRTIRLPEGRKDLSRKSFAIYLYTCERAPEETAPSHATVYVPDVRPPEVDAGVTLTAGHVRDLDVRFRNLRNQLRFLYDREKDFARHIDQLERALLEARAAQRFPLQGFAVQPNAVQGVWPDQWCTDVVEFSLQPTRAAHELRLQVFVPPEMAGEQLLTVTAAAHEGRTRIAPGQRSEVVVPCRVGVGVTVKVRIEAARTWVPAAGGHSTDSRVLAFHLRSAVLE